MTAKSFGHAAGSVLCAVYLPYLILFVVAGASVSLLALWPIFPGLAISVLLPPTEFFRWFRGMGSVVFFTVFYAAAWCGLAWRFRRMLWVPVIVAAIASLGFVRVMLMALRA